MPVLNPLSLIDNRVNAIQAYHQQTHITRAELDISGGIDSAVMLGLLTRALGANQITAVYTGIHSSNDSKERAQAAAQAFGVPLVTLDLTVIFENTVAALRAGLYQAGYDLKEIESRTQADPAILGGFRSCLRAPVGRVMNRLTGGGIRHGTGNECEDRWVRFYQKGGDGEVDTNPIAMLSKGEVYQLAEALGVPSRIIQATPAPDLQANGEKHTDEGELFQLTGCRWTYSRPHYSQVGTIERLSRWLDHPFQNHSSVELVLFGSIEPNWESLTESAKPYFPEFSSDEIRQFLQSARRMEAMTRHKLNPNCPMLGSRYSLVSAGILTNQLPLKSMA